MTGVLYYLVVVCVSQLPCRDEAMRAEPQNDYQACVTELDRRRLDDGHRGFCVPMRVAGERP